MSKARQIRPGMREIENPTCTVCGLGSKTTVDWLQYLVWQGGGLIQTAFPNMSAGQREMMISGTHPFCWKEMMGEDDES
jgi:hypothetical protein